MRGIDRGARRRGAQLCDARAVEDRYRRCERGEGARERRAIRDEDSSNSTFYANPELDRVLDQARTTLERPGREALYRRAEQILYDDAPWIWDYHRRTAELIQPYVHYQPHPIWLRDYTSAWLDVGPDEHPVRR